MLDRAGRPRRLPPTLLGSVPLGPELSSVRSPLAGTERLPCLRALEDLFVVVFVFRDTLVEHTVSHGRQRVG